MTPLELRDGITIDWDVAMVLLNIERRGGSFEVEHTTLKVLPKGVLTDADKVYLAEHKDEVLRQIRLSDWPHDAHLRA